MNLERRKEYDRTRSKDPKRKEYMKKYLIEYRKKNKEKLDECRRNYYGSHKEHIDNYQKFYRSTHREEFKEYAKKYYLKNKDIIGLKIKDREDFLYNDVHNRTSKIVRKLKCRPLACPICGGGGRIECHHPDYARWYEVVFCCKGCHERIHHGFVKDYLLVNLLECQSEKKC